MTGAIPARERAAWALAAVIFLALALASPRMNMYYQNLVILVAMNVAIATAWGLLAETGQLSLGHSGLFAVGAYTSGLLYRHFHLPLEIGMFLGGLPAAALGAFIAYLCRRMPRWGLAIVTLAMAELIRILLNNLRRWTFGAEGITVPPLLNGNRSVMLLVALGIAACGILVLYAVRRSRLRLTFAAILNDEAAAAAAGVNVTGYKVYAFALSGLVTGLVGSFYTPYITFIDPISVASVHISLEAQLMPILGGLHTLSGPVLGAVLLTVMAEFLRARFVAAHLLVYGFVLMTVMIFLPRGLAGLARRLWHRRDTGAGDEEVTGGAELAAPISASGSDQA